ncbi:MAG: hypothetical protein HYX63_24225 [Gammaproteobacteria bacterium]|nr:hypothetical protein [Gammaproteobacteria bacterium]
MNTSAQRKPVAGEAAEPVFVFGTNVAGVHDEGTAVAATRFHGATAGVWNGMAGNSYAIPYRSSDRKLLGAKHLSEYVATFLEFAKSHPATIFRVARFGCEKDAYLDRDMAPLFRNAPSNCAIPALWQREIGRLDTSNIIIYDPLIRLANAEWRTHLKAYLAINLPLWGTEKYQLLSISNTRGVSAIPQTAEEYGCKYREIKANKAYYKEHTEQASEMLTVWHGTHLINITDPDQTTLPSHVRILTSATRDGLFIDDLGPHR